MVDNTFDMIQRRIRNKSSEIEFKKSIKTTISSKPTRIEKGEDSLDSFKLPCGKNLAITEMYVDPSKCKIWSGNNRLEENRTDLSLEELKQLIQAQGQLIPGFIRPLRDDPKYIYEVIYGSRRFAACKSLDKEFLAICGDIDNKNALLLMDAENNARKDLSVYEKALSYKQWLSEKVFKDRDDLANHLGVSGAWISRTQSILKLPEEVLNAFEKKSDITVWWATELLKIVKHSMDSKQRLIDAALKKPVKINEPMLICKYLLSSSEKLPIKVGSKQKKNALKKEKITDKDGNLVCCISETGAGKVQVIFEKNHRPKDVKSLLEKSLSGNSSWEF